MSAGKASEAKFAPPLPHPRYRSGGSDEWRVGLSHPAITERGLAPVGRGRDISAGDPRDEAAYHGQGQVVHAFLLSLEPKNSKLPNKNRYLGRTLGFVVERILRALRFDPLSS